MRRLIEASTGSLALLVGLDVAIRLVLSADDPVSVAKSVDSFVASAF